MTSTAAFGHDEGTLHYAEGSLALAALWETPKWRRQVKPLVQQRPLIWFVDDERRNREWFAEHHRQHFAILTLSSLDYCRRALDRGTPCDLVVTDIFFPAQPVESDTHAGRLLEIYQQIQRTAVSDLPSLWADERAQWALDGFEVARVTARAAAARRERIPVLLFSRKATLLLGTEDWLAEPPAVVQNTFWLLEKIDPSITGEPVRKAACIQRDRMISALRLRSAAAPWWLKLLGRLRLGWGPVAFSLGSGQGDVNRGAGDKVDSTVWPAS